MCYVSGFYLSRLTYSDTSKHSNETSLYGTRGCFLASLSAVSIMTIASRHRAHQSCNSLTMYNTKVLGRSTPTTSEIALTNLSHGTRVTVRDLFGTMPVRVRQRAIMSERNAGNVRYFERLRRKTVLLILCYGSRVRIHLQNSENSQTLRLYSATANPYDDSLSIVDFVCGILSQAGMIAPNEKEHWVSLSASTSSVSINGVVCLIPHANKSIQLLGVGANPIDGEERFSLLHDEVNHLFHCSEFGTENEERRLSDKGGPHQTSDRLARGDLKSWKGVDRWAKYFLRVETRGRGVRVTNDLLEKDQRLLQTITELLHVMITAFLTKYNFQPKTVRPKNPTTRQNANRFKVETKEDVPKGKDVKDARNNGLPQDIDATAVVSHDVDLLPSKLRGNLIGTVVAIPFLQTLVPQPKSGSNMSSRIKKGLRVAANMNSVLGQPRELHRSQSVPPLSTKNWQTRHASPNVLPAVNNKTQSLLKSGQLRRIPFEDLVSSTPFDTENPSSELSGEYPEDEDVRLWTNPVTRSRSIIDLKTGRTMSRKRKEISYSGPDISTFESNARPSSAPGSLTKSQILDQDEKTWLSSVLRSWNNPVFAPAEVQIPQVYFEGVGDATQNLWHGSHGFCSEAELDRAFKNSFHTIEGRVSKETLRDAKVIAQVDYKFILIKTSFLDGKGHSENADDQAERLFLIDQHAADERIQLEGLMQSFFRFREDGLGLATFPLEKPIKIELSAEELSLSFQYQSQFTFWGIIYQSADRNRAHDAAAVHLHGSQNLAVYSLPATIHERCKQEPRLLLQLLRSELWRLHESRHVPNWLDNQPLGGGSWVELVSRCPRGIVELLNSRACRSAIMFNDPLSKVQCERLVRGLSECLFPFQCAHGRPSLVPVVNLPRLGQLSGTWGEAGQEVDFATSYQAWTPNAGEDCSR